MRKNPAPLATKPAKKNGRPTSIESMSDAELAIRVEFDSEKNATEKTAGEELDFGKIPAGYRQFLNVNTFDPGERAALMMYAPTGLAILSAQFAGKSGAQTVNECAGAFLRDLEENLGCRDHVERMLLQQMYVTHLRIMTLQNQLYRARPTFETLRTLGDLLERASNTYRRQMLALAEYRTPRASATFIKQLNQANQQVIQNEISEEKKSTNKIQSSGGGKQRALLSDVSERAEAAIGAGKTRETVEVGNGAEDSGRKGPKLNERVATRRTKRSRNQGEA